MSAPASLLVNLDVDDLDRATRFYTEALGLTVGRQVPHGFVELLGAAAPLYLLPKKGGTRATEHSSDTRRYERHWTPVHLDFAVVALDAAVERAVAAGAVVERAIREEPYGRIAVLADPFGHGFCLIEFNARGYDAFFDQKS